ncbi:hypothetical protein BU17DRAFT_80991 [Hysterangium stoloniferum]|nr:hypothetical protein BU17DRAFT_80991 [Hysterangium stoloniferum]
MAYSASTYKSVCYPSSQDTRYQQVDWPGTFPPPNSSYGGHSTFPAYSQSSGHALAECGYPSKTGHPDPESYRSDRPQLEKQTYANNPSSSNGQSSKRSFQAISTQSSVSILYPSSPSRRHACDQCTLAFDRPHDLKRHRQTHTNTKHYQCPACDKTFTRKDAVKRHQAGKACGLGLEIRKTM